MLLVFCLIKALSSEYTKFPKISNRKTYKFIFLILSCDNMLRLSKLYGTDIYTEEGGFIGKVHDVVLNMESGEIIRLTTEPLRDITKEEARVVLKNKSILYKNVLSASDIIIVGRRTAGAGLSESIEEPENRLRPKGAIHSLTRERKF